MEGTIIIKSKIIFFLFVLLLDFNIDRNKKMHFCIEKLYYIKIFVFKMTPVIVGILFLQKPI